MLKKIEHFLATIMQAKKFWAITFGLILLVGIFLRTYNFQTWLYFYPDQARDVILTEDVLTGKKAWPLLGAIAASTPFKIGPMYYYFQIITGKIFGASPAKMALPDLFFGILSIPVLYYFLRRYFAKNLSLLMMGFYAISFYMVRYARFAWNPNPMPFFVMLFLVGLTEFLTDKEKTAWKWICLIGITTGIGMQLHTILFLLLPAILLIAFVYLLWKNKTVWQKCLAIIILAMLLNAGQIASELDKNFANTKLLFDLSSGASERSVATTLKNFGQDVVCNAQANAHMLTSIGDENDCDFFTNLLRIKKHQAPIDLNGIIFVLQVCLSLLFTCLGFGAMIHYLKKEKDAKRKYFLLVILIYVALSFGILFPVIDGINLRYFLYLTFVPYLLLAFLLKFLFEKYPQQKILLSLGTFLLVVSMNFATIFAEIKAHSEKSRSTDTYVVLGELALMRDYIIAQSAPAKEAHFLGGYKYIQNYSKPLGYLLDKEGFDLLRTKSEDRIIDGIPAFFMGPVITPDFLQENPQIKHWKNFGQVGIYQIEK